MKSKAQKRVEQIVHGQCGRKPSGAYRSWLAMLRRCRNKKDRLYGAKGISVCEPWLSFERFYADMGDRPEGMSIGRIDGSKGYFAANCRWETTKEQTRNTSHNRRITFNGKTRVLCDWEERLGLPNLTLARRLYYGWSEEDALTKPIGWRHPVGQTYSFEGKSQGLYCWAKEYAMHPSTLKGRLDKGWSIEKALREPLDVSHRRNFKRPAMSKL